MLGRHLCDTHDQTRLRSPWLPRPSGTRRHNTASARRLWRGTQMTSWRPSWLAAAVPLVAVVVVSQGEELEERQELVPGVAPPVAWVFELGSCNQRPEGLGKWGRHQQLDQDGAGDAPVWEKVSVGKRGRRITAQYRPKATAPPQAR